MTQAHRVYDQPVHGVTDGDRAILEALMQQPTAVREAVIEHLDPAYQRRITSILFPSCGVKKGATGYEFAGRFQPVDLHAIRKSIEECRTCRGFLEVQHDDYGQAVATCVPCGRPAEVTNGVG